MMRLLPRTAAAWEALGVWMQALTTLIVAVAVAFVGSAHWQQDKTLELQEQWASTEMQARRGRLTDAIVCRAAEQGMNETLDTRGRLHLVLPSAGYMGIDADLPAYLDFFTEARICVRSGVCDAALACAQFEPQARGLDKWYRPFIERQQVMSRDPSYGSDFNDFVATCRELAPSSQPEAPRMVNTPRQDVLQQEMGQEIADAMGRQPRDDMREPGLASQRAAACGRMTPGQGRGEAGGQTAGSGARQ